MLKYYKKGCEHNWSDGCFAAGMKLRYHSDSITNPEERAKSFIEASSFDDHTTDIQFINIKA